MVQLQKTKDKRSEDRDERFKGEFCLHLVSEDNLEWKIAIRPTDVSRRGLGFVVKENLRKGAFYWLLINRHKFRVELAYCHNHLGIDGMYRCGLFLREADGDLREICEAEALLELENKDSSNLY
jgi:hypothetical protein